MRVRAMGLAIFGVAIAAAIAGAWPPWVDVYARKVYPTLQAVVTPVSNRVPFPLFDLVLVGALVSIVIAGVTAVRRAVRRRTLWPLVRVTAATLVAGAIFYVWFAGAWGYNYRRPGVEASLQAFEAGRTTPGLVRRLAEVSVARTNALHGEAHTLGFPPADVVPVPLLRSLHAVEQRLGRPRPTTPTTPKRPWTTPYMRAVGVSGMLAPLFLETYLNPDLTGPERPIVLAHEWAHLSGWAPEEDASFVGLLAALGADVPAQYSAWLFLATEAGSRLHPVTRDLVLKELAPGPRADLAAIADRLEARVAWLDRASWVAYDRAIKSQGAVEGVAGYGRVIDLVLGSRILDGEGVTP